MQHGSDCDITVSPIFVAVFFFLAIKHPYLRLNIANPVATINKKTLRRVDLNFLTFLIFIFSNFTFCRPSGIFSITLVLPEHACQRVEFVFLVDGEWRLRRDLPVIPNGYGRYNNVLFDLFEV